MHVRKHSDQGFDDFRRERKRVRAKLGPQASVLGYDNQALRELEQVEAREVRDQQLTREVHEFFAEATRQAAAIVNKVSTEAKEEVGRQLESEVESFLIDALSRMNSFVVSVMQQRRGGNIAETQVEPHVGHIVGQDLDEFRWAGTAETGDKHIGQDPFATPLEEVQREFRAVVSEMDATANPVASIEDHLVAQAEAPTADAPVDDDAAPTSDDALANYAAQAGAVPPVSDDHEPVDAPTAATPPAAKSVAADSPPAAAARADNGGGQGHGVDAELEGFKAALKALVRQGVMKREEARAAWQARLVSVGRATE